jgi:hypothetical protein
MPGIAAITRPALATAIAIASALAAGQNAWASAGISIVVFCALALLLDRKVIGDLRWVAGIKSHVADGSTGRS